MPVGSVNVPGPTWIRNRFDTEFVVIDANAADTDVKSPPEVATITTLATFGAGAPGAPVAPGVPGAPGGPARLAVDGT